MWGARCGRQVWGAGCGVPGEHLHRRLSLAPPRLQPLLITLCPHSHTHCSLPLPAPLATLFHTPRPHTPRPHTPHSQGVAEVASGDLYITQTFDSTLRIVSNGIISTFGTSSGGAMDGSISVAQFNGALGVRFGGREVSLGSAHG